MDFVVVHIHIDGHIADREGGIHGVVHRDLHVLVLPALAEEGETVNHLLVGGLRDEPHPDIVAEEGLLAL